MPSLHGYYARDVMLPWESKEEFERLHKELKEEFNPKGRSEHEAVLELAQLYWRRPQVVRLWSMEILKSPFCQKILDTDGESWAEVRMNLRAEGRKEGTKQAEAERACAEMIALFTVYIERIQRTADVDEMEAVLHHVDQLKGIAASLNEVCKELQRRASLRRRKRPGAPRKTLET